MPGEEGEAAREWRGVLRGRPRSAARWHDHEIARDVADRDPAAVARHRWRVHEARLGNRRRGDLVEPLHAQPTGIGRGRAEVDDRASVVEDGELSMLSA